MKPLLFVLLLIAVKYTAAQADSVQQQKDTLPVRDLKSITVAATKRPIEVYPDKTVINVEAQSAAVGENALELLRRSPGVLVDGQDNISLAGRPNVAVFIDGKATQLSATDLAQLLKTVQAANIKQVELITNPSSKYDAAGNGGIINIKLKKSLSNGVNGNITGSHAQSTHARQNGAVNVTWRSGKLASFANGGINRGLQHTIANNTRQGNGRSFSQQSLERDYFNGTNVRWGIDYTLSKKQTLGFLYAYNYRYTRMENSSATFIQYPAGADTTILTNSVAPFPTKRTVYNLNYSYSTEGTQVSIDADYTRFHSGVNNALQNTVQNGRGQKLYADAAQNNAAIQIQLAALKGDWTKNFKSGLKVEAGFKTAYAQTMNNLVVQANNGRQWTADTGKTNLFHFNEAIHALYGIVKKEKGKWYAQAGLRTEYTEVKGLSTDLKGTETKKPDTAYLNVFPTLYVQYKWAQKHQLGFTANRRIDRPLYQDQNPFVYALDALNSEQGNPYLQPQFTYAAELSYTYQYATSVKLGYAVTTNYIEQLTYQNGKNTILIPQNAGTKQMWSLSISTPLQPRPWWSMYLSATPYFHYYQISLSGFGITQQINNGSFAFNGYVGNTLKLGKGWTGDVNGWFSFQNRATIYVSKPLGSINCGVQKNILKEKATLKCSITDIFNTQRWQQTAQTQNLYLTTYRKWESRNLTAGFSWRFGNAKIKAARERQTDADEKGRIK